MRTLETLIRLSTAHAKLRLATHVETSDMDVAWRLLDMTIFNEPPIEEIKEEADEEMEGEDEAAAGDTVVPLKQKSGRAQRT